MAGETSVGGISGFLKMDADQFHRELEKAIAEIDALKGKEAKVRIEVDADQVHRELPIVREEIDQVSRSNDTLGSSSRNAGGGVPQQPRRRHDANRAQNHANQETDQGSTNIQ